VSFICYGRRKRDQAEGTGAIARKELSRSWAGCNAEGWGWTSAEMGVLLLLLKWQLAQLI